MKTKIFEAMPIYNKKNKEWNILVSIEDGRTLKLGEKIDDLFMKYTAFESEEEAIKYIENDERLKLSYIRVHGRMK